MAAFRDRKSTRLNSSHTEIYTLSLHDALPISKCRFNDLRIRGGVNLERLVIRPLPAVADRGNGCISQASHELRLGQHLVEKRLPHLRRDRKSLRARSALEHHMLAHRESRDRVERDLSLRVENRERTRRLAFLTGQQEEALRLKEILGAQAVKKRQYHGLSQNAPGSIGEWLFQSQMIPRIRLHMGSASGSARARCRFS